MTTRHGVALALVVAVAACGERDADAPPPAAAPADQPPGAEVPTVALPQGVTQDMVAQGQQLFTGLGGCLACHGADATGTALGPNLRDQQWLNTDGSYEQIVQVIQSGVPQPVEYPGMMPPLGGARLSDEQVRQLGAYVYAISRGG